jgi:hypothetical protein
VADSHSRFASARIHLVYLLAERLADVESVKLDVDAWRDPSIRYRRRTAVLAQKYLTSSPGATKNDTVILSRTQ